MQDREFKESTAVHAVIPCWKKDAAIQDFLETIEFSPPPLEEHFRMDYVNYASRGGSDCQRFLDKLLSDGSFDALAVLATFEIALTHQPVEAIEKLVVRDGESPDEVPPLLVEGWPLIQHILPWMSCLLLYHKIFSSVHMVTLPHPLTKFATELLPYFSPPEFEKAVRVALDQRIIPKIPNNYLQACQLFLDYVASSQPRTVAVLLYDPLSETSSTTILQQSCFPSATLELSVSDDNFVRYSIVPIYDLGNMESPTVCTRQVLNDCTCCKCSYSRSKDANLLAFSCSPQDTKRIAHILFQEEKYDQARKLYLLCLDFLTTDHEQFAEVWHAMGAIELARLHFLSAQYHWREGSNYASIHSGISLQLTKQEAYEYFLPLQHCGMSKTFEYEVLLPARLYLAENVVSQAQCGQLVKWAQNTAAKGGWETSRHYAVPTTDIPVHECTPMLLWFRHWINTKIQTLLRKQFNTTKRFYVHDAFVAQYAASYRNTFLPLHYDESTHSMVLALNDDFEGGGSYFYNIDRTISPSTGSLVTFRGNTLLHGGIPVTKGTRYILAIFLYLDEDCNQQPFTSTLESGPAAKSAKRQKVASGKGFTFSFFS